MLALLAQDVDGRAFCYSNADIRKGEEAEEIFRFISFWERTHGQKPRHLVFDSKLTTYKGLVRLDDLGIAFITLRRRTAKLLDEVAAVAASAWRTVELDVPARKFKTPPVFEQTVTVERPGFPPALRPGPRSRRAHHPPRQRAASPRSQAHHPLRPAHAHKNILSDVVRFFHMNALSSTVGLKIDFDMALLVIASGLYRLLARRLRGYRDAHAKSSATSSTCPRPSRSTTRASASHSTDAPTCPSSTPPACSNVPSSCRGGTA